MCVLYRGSADTFRICRPRSREHLIFKLKRNYSYSHWDSVEAQKWLQKAKNLNLINTCGCVTLICDESLIQLSLNSQWSCCSHHHGSSTDCCWPGTGRGRWLGGSRRRWCLTPPNVSSLSAAPPPGRGPHGEGWPEVRGDRRTQKVTMLAERSQSQRELVQDIKKTNKW